MEEGEAVVQEARAVAGQGTARSVAMQVRFEILRIRHVRFERSNSHTPKHTRTHAICMQKFRSGLLMPLPLPFANALKSSCPKGLGILLHCQFNGVEILYSRAKAAAVADKQTYTSTDNSTHE